MSSTSDKSKSGWRIAQIISKTYGIEEFFQIARIESRDLDAMRLYEKAIHSSPTSGFVHNEALAYELASAFYRARGFDQFADTYLLNARACYASWGADGKVRQLDRLYPGLKQRDLLPGPTSTIIETACDTRITVARSSLSTCAVRTRASIAISKVVRRRFAVWLTPTFSESRPGMSTEPSWRPMKPFFAWCNTIMKMSLRVGCDGGT